MAPTNSQYLSQGARHYSKAKKIHPRDSVAQLAYYLPTASSGSSLSSATLPTGSSSSAASTLWSDKRRSSRRLKSQPAERLSPTAVNSSGFSEGTQAGEPQSIRGEELGLKTPNGVLLADWNLNSRQLHRRVYQAEDDEELASIKAHKQRATRRYASKDLQFADLAGRSTAHSADSSKASSLAADLSPFNEHNINSNKLVANQLNSTLYLPRSHLGTRMKRRNMNRINRRMLTLGDDHHLVNPYALSELFSQSEIPGFREIFASDSYLRKFCWIVAFLFMTVLSLNDMTELITEYYEYPITVDVRLRDSARLPFPAVTVCNLNIVRFSSLCSSSASLKLDLTNQIPSELRDKLCGIQVEKKNQSDQSDISDINNIGITTTTTSTTTTTTATTTTTTATTATPTATTNTAATPASDEPNTTSGSPTLTPAAAGSSTTAKPARATSRPPAAAEQPTVGGPADSLAASTTARGIPAEHKLVLGGDGQKSTTATATSPMPVTAPTAPSTKTTGTTLNGALDLGDFADPALLVMNRGPTYDTRRRAHGRRVTRSIKLSDSGATLGDESEYRPFASIKSRVRLKKSQWPEANDSPAASGSPEFGGPNLRQILGANPPRRRQSSASQFIKPPGPMNVAANRVNGGLPGGQSPSRNGFPVNPNVQQTQPNGNPMQNPFFAPMTPTTSQPPPTPTSQANATNNNNGNNNINNNFVPAALPEDFELTERQERELQENLTNWLAVMNNRDPQLTWSLGHQFDDMILRCTMKSINCTHQRSFENSFSPTEGNCFTYRSRIKRKSSASGNSMSGASKGGAGGGGSSSATKTHFEEANLAGTNHGLELVLNLEKNEYISGSSQVGALVMIHHPSDLGYAASEATFIAPEFTTYIGLKMVNITRLPAPYPEYCVDSWPEKFADKLTRNSTYSQQACLRICLQKTIQSHCQCQSAFLPVVELDDLPSDAPSIVVSKGEGNANKSNQIDSTATDSGGGTNKTTSAPQFQQRIIICDTRKLHTRQCVREVMFRAADRVHHCECPPKCQVTRYDKTISMARWPTREDKVTFDRGKMDVNFQNLAKVIVYFQTMTCEEVTQQAVFNAAKLFSALGGIMGMYVGFSFLSVFEIFEVMSRKMWHYFTVKIYNTTSRLMGNFRA